MKNKVLSVGVIVAILAIVSAGSPVFATSTPQLGNSTTTRSTQRATKLEATSIRLQKRADQEIDRRVTALGNLQTKIGAMKKIPSSLQSSFATTIQGQISLLDNLKTKISADTDTATLKSDVQSITKSYRIYALILPQTQIVAAADRLASTTDMLTAYAIKLQTRITALGTTGKDVTSLQSTLTDMQAKIADAKTQVQNVIAGVSGLVPDNGDKTIMAANTAALKTARTAIQTGTKDVKAANKDANTIKQGLRKLSPKTLDDRNSTTTATSTSSN